MPSRGPPPCPKPSNAIPTRLGSWQSDLPLQPSLGFRVVKKIRSKGIFLLLTDSYRLHSGKQRLEPSRTWTALECGQSWKQRELDLGWLQYQSRPRTERDLEPGQMRVGKEAFSRKNASQALQVNERLRWPMLQTPTRCTLWHPQTASGPSLEMSDGEIRCTDLRGNEEFIHVSHLNTIKRDAQPWHLLRVRTPKWTVIEMSPPT